MRLVQKNFLTKEEATFQLSQFAKNVRGMSGDEADDEEIVGYGWAFARAFALQRTFLGWVNVTTGVRTKHTGSLHATDDLSRYSHSLGPCKPSPRLGR